MTTGIYKIENLINHKCYIGQSIHIERRWQEHCQPSAKSCVANAIKKYGKTNFSFQVLEECLENELDEKEIFYINKYNSIVPNGYNIMDYIEKQETTFCFYDKEIFLNIVKDIEENILSTQEIADKYEINRRTVYRINCGDVHRLPEKSYPLRPVISKGPRFCPGCGAKLNKGTIRCKKCADIAQRIVDRPERNELKELVRNNSFVSIGKMYSVSDNTIRKWCKAYNLPNKASEIKKMSDKEWELI